MKIENSQQAKYYYKHINDLLKNYIEDWGIKPSNLRKYFKKNSKKYNNFLERNGLMEIKGIKTILDDILDDLYSFEKEYVKKFESFVSGDNNSLKNIFYKNIKESDIKMEKILADYFDTNLSDVKPISSSKHLFKISTWDSDDLVYIYDEEDLNIIKNNIIEYFYNHISSKEVDILYNISFVLKNIVSFDDFNQKIEDKIDNKKIIEIISELLSSEFLENYNNFYIWKSNV